MLLGYAELNVFFRPVEDYAEPKKKVNPDVIKLRYDFFEHKRQEMIKVIKRSRLEIIEETSG